MLKLPCLPALLRSCTATAGEMVEVEPGLRHRFGAESNAVIFTLNQG